MSKNGLTPLVAAIVLMVGFGLAGVAWGQQAEADAEVVAPAETAVDGETYVEAESATEPVAETPLAVSDEPVPAERDWVARVKQPVDWFSWGFDQRLRHTYINNAFNLDRSLPNREWNFQRYRSRLWGSLKPVEEFELQTRLVWESRYWWKPDAREGYDCSDVIIDKLNFVFNKPFGLPVKVQAGRFDMILGDGWLVLDGTPLDGSRTIFFNGVRSTWEFKDIDTTAEVVWVQNYSDPDVFLPPIGSKDVPLVEQDEVGAIFWLTNRSIKNLEMNGYFIYKHNDAVLANGDDGDLYTFGARGVYDFAKHWRFDAQGAIQFGNNRLRDVWAGAAKTSLTYLFRDTWDNQLSVLYEFLSGDDPDTDTNEQFNPLWGRWPQFAEVIIYNYATETRVAEVTNLHRLGFGWQANPTKKMQLAATYQLLFADENSFRGNPAMFSGSGCFRGQLATAILRYKFNRFLSGHLLGEWFEPGNYYSDNRDDGALFARAELVFAF